MGVHDIDDITEEMIAAIPEGVLKVLFASPMCNDFSKLRLLPDRKDYCGPKRRPGEDPRAGLDGKYGRTFRTVIKIIQWVLKYHPHALYFVENVEFKAMGGALEGGLGRAEQPRPMDFTHGEPSMMRTPW